MYSIVYKSLFLAVKQGTVLTALKHVCDTTNFAYRSKKNLPSNAQEQCLKYPLHVCLPHFSLPWALLHKGLGVLGNNWASSVAGCGRILSYLHYYTFYLGGGQFLFISPQMKIHPSNLEGGRAPKQMDNFTWTPCTEYKSD